MEVTKANLATYLAELTPSATPHPIEITETVASDWGNSDTAGTVGNIIKTNTPSGVYLDLGFTVIPDTISIMQFTFSGCTPLIKAPAIPRGVTLLYFTFADCIYLTELPVVPISVVSMNNVCLRCSALTTVNNVPANVTGLAFSFYDCTSLHTIQNFAVNVGNCNMTNAFFNCPALANIYVTTLSESTWHLLHTNTGATGTDYTIYNPDGTVAGSGTVAGTSQVLTLYGKSDELVISANITPTLAEETATSQVQWHKSGLPYDDELMIFNAKNPDTVISNFITVNRAGEEFLGNALTATTATTALTATTATLADRAKDSYPIPTDAVLQYSFDEIGDVIIDNSYSEAHAENHGVIPVDGVCGKAGYFNNSYMIAPRPALGDDITIYFWAKLDALGTQTIVQSRTVTGSGLTVFQIGSTYRLDWRGNQSPFYGYTPPVNTWHHVCMKMNATTKVLKINGEVKVTQTGTYGTTANLASIIWFGLSGEGGTLSGNILTGALDGLKIVPRFTTDDEDTGEYKARANHPKFYATAQTATKLATARKINGVDFDGTADVYDTYSTTETRIGTWIDGKPLYRKVVSLGTLPDSTIKTVPHGISNIGFCKKTAIAISSTAIVQLPFIPVSNLNQGVDIYMTNTSIIITTQLDRTNYTGTAILEYTKTTD